MKTWAVLSGEEHIQGGHENCLHLPGGCRVEDGLVLGCVVSGERQEAVSGSREKKIAAQHSTDSARWMENARMTTTC